MSTPKILLVAPHPDDFIISCSGFVLKHGSNYDYDVLLMASENIRPSTETRIKEELTAISSIETVIGNKINHIVYPGGRDTQLHLQFNDIVNYIQSMVTKTEYKIVFFPYHTDTHQDHRAVNEAVLAACRYDRNLLMYETPSTINFKPNIFVELPEAVINRKMEISEHYTSQILGPNHEHYHLTLSDYIYTKASAHGATTRTCRYAEGYTSYRMFL